MPHRRAVLAAPLAGLAVPARAATPWALITPEEFAASERAGGTPPLGRSFGQGAGPRIEVESPSETVDLQPPVTIRLRFRPSAGAAIDPRAFRALYGALRLDVTDRLRRHARVDAAGLVAENVALPAGSHRLVLQIADDQGRRGERDFRLRVA